MDNQAIKFFDNLDSSHSPDGVSLTPNAINALKTATKVTILDLKLKAYVFPDNSVFVASHLKSSIAIIGAYSSLQEAKRELTKDIG